MSTFALYEHYTEVGDVFYNKRPRPKTNHYNFDVISKYEQQFIAKNCSSNLGAADVRSSSPIYKNYDSMEARDGPSSTQYGGDYDEPYYEARSPIADDPKDDDFEDMMVDRPENIDGFEPMQFKKVANTQELTQKVAVQRRIYGDEYMQPLMLNATPRGDKTFLLDRVECEMFDETGMPVNKVATAGATNCMETESSGENCKTSRVSAAHYLPLASRPPQVYNDDDDDAVDKLNMGDLQVDDFQFAIDLKPIPKDAALQPQTPQNCPIPTCTKLNYIQKWIDHRDIPELCKRCFGIECFCSVLDAPHEF